MAGNLALDDSCYEFLRDRVFALSGKPEFFEAIRDFFAYLFQCPELFLLVSKDTAGSGQSVVALAALKELGCDDPECLAADDRGYCYVFTSMRRASAFAKKHAGQLTRGTLQAKKFTPLCFLEWLMQCSGSLQGTNGAVLQGVWWNGGPEAANSAQNLYDIFTTLVTEKRLAISSAD